MEGTKLENEISNYFVLNRDSELWKDRTLFSDKGFASLTPDVSFRLKKKIDIPLKLSYLDNNSPKTKDVLTDPNSLFSFAIDKYNMLYILEKDTKKIRKLSIDRYEQYGSTDTDNMIFDEYIISCKGLGNPQSIAVTNRHIYILENSTLYVLSKIDYKLVKTINFRDKINLFKITEDEAIVFYSYSDEKTVLYKKNLVWDDKFSRGDGKEYQIINLSKSMKLDEDITDIDVNNREQEDDSKDNNNTHRHGNSESNDNNHVNNDRVSRT